MPQANPKDSEMVNNAPAEPNFNPFILYFCRVLLAEKGEELDPHDLKNVLEDMYRVFEFMLGRNLVNSLPEDQRKEYIEITEAHGVLTYEKIGEFFNKNIVNYKQIMKDTLKEFAEIYMNNRNFDPEQYGVEEKAA